MSKIYIYLFLLQITLMTSFDFSDLLKCVNILLIIVVSCIYFRTKAGKNLLHKFVKEFEMV